MPGDFHVQPEAPDPVLSEEAVLSLVRRHVPETRAVTAVDESGGEARTYTIDDALILKTQRPQQLRPTCMCRACSGMAFTTTHLRVASASSTP